ncbi:MAG TPA: hypothetical protein VH298_08200, partial [Jatrophihabitans sp.]|nr:hypothetical protein [Jatrophihabitans sp.]
HGCGLHSANAAARQHLSGHTPPGTQLFGCILVPDGPGRLSRPMLAEISRQVPGVYPMTFAAPWADEYRMFDPDTSEHWPPLPAEMEQLARRVTDLLAWQCWATAAIVTGPHRPRRHRSRPARRRQRRTAR